MSERTFSNGSLHTDETCARCERQKRWRPVAPLGKALRSIREHYGFKHETVAAKAGVTPDAVALAEMALELDDAAFWQLAGSVYRLNQEWAA